MLEHTRVCLEPNRRQKLLQRLVLLSLKELLAALRFLQPEIVLKPASYRIIQRQLQRLLAHRMRRYAAKKRIACGVGVPNLRSSRRSSGNDEDRKKRLRLRPPKHKMSR